MNTSIFAEGLPILKEFSKLKSNENEINLSLSCSQSNPPFYVDEYY